MNEWSKESLEEMFGDNVIEQLTFLSGCTKHSYCNPSHTALNGYIVSYEKLEKFAELIVQECKDLLFESSENNRLPIAVDDMVHIINTHFGVKE